MAFAQSRHVAVIHGQFEKSPFDRECVVGPGELKHSIELRHLAKSKGHSAPLNGNADLRLPRTLGGGA